MTKFHINKHGVPAPCRATKGNCPLGGEESHFDSQAEAQAYADKQNEAEHSLLPQEGESVGYKPNLREYNPKFEGAYNPEFSPNDDEYDVATKLSVSMAKNMYNRAGWNMNGLENDESEGYLQLEDGYDAHEWTQEILQSSPIGGIDDEDKYNNERAKYDKLQDAVDIVIEESEKGKSASDVIQSTERRLVDKFNNDHFAEDKFQSMRNEHGEVYPEHVDAASGFLKHAMNDPKAYRYLGNGYTSEGANEYVAHYARATGTDPQDLNHWTTHHAMRAAEDYYNSPLSQSFSNNEERAENTERTFRDWVGSRFD